MTDECPHGRPKNEVMPDGRPRCPLCRREETLKARHPGHAHWDPQWDPQSAAANDLPDEEE